MKRALDLLRRHWILLALAALVLASRLLPHRQPDTKPYPENWGAFGPNQSAQCSPVCKECHDR